MRITYLYQYPSGLVSTYSEIDGVVYLAKVTEVPNIPTDRPVLTPSPEMILAGEMEFCDCVAARDFVSDANCALRIYLAMVSKIHPSSQP